MISKQRLVAATAQVAMAAASCCATGVRTFCQERKSGGLEGGGRPVGPLVDHGAGGGIEREGQARAILRGKVADDGVAFPHDQIAIAQHGHEPVGVEREIVGRVGAAEAAPGGMS